MGDDESHSEHNLNSFISAPIRVFNGVTETLFLANNKMKGGRHDEQGRKKAGTAFRIQSN